MLVLGTRYLPTEDAEYPSNEVVGSHSGNKANKQVRERQLFQLLRPLLLQDFKKLIPYEMT